MAWICLCQSHVPDVPPYHWPVTLAECQGKEQACMNNCFYGSTKTICIDACSRYYTCDKAGSPFSGLRVEREDQTPTYGNSSSSSSYSFNRYICAIYFFVYYFIYSYM
ncbi:uncharacterized protein EV154DRAFT_583319 [Mucor mucedo]|uniref:uncharacterized protein n=1 Tax=Mucor mucedo TaxID=29922 RepID=UPI00221FD64E|nr:uncharacterized protein EV154DRAFT_583319 [Mucor mucedo]KAI7893414.1 hypothetical protein EV154DRAFT_583319 [Mucor mucedo]